MNSDYILRITESIGKISAKIFFNKEPKEFENIKQGSMSGEDILPILLKRLVLQGKYNEAENILFEELHRSPSNGLVNIGKDFYNLLLSKSDEELIKASFPREEIFQGLKDIEVFNPKNRQN